MAEIVVREMGITEATASSGEALLGVANKANRICGCGVALGLEAQEQGLQGVGHGDDARLVVLGPLLSPGDGQSVPVRIHARLVERNDRRRNPWVLRVRQL